MKSKAEIITTHLKGKTVLDLGGSGYGEDNPYERQLRQAWSYCAKRITVDQGAQADIQVDFNQLPLPTPPQENIDITTAFDVLEHLAHPVDVLRWIPTNNLIVSLPNSQSFIARRMEEKGDYPHLYSFTAFTAQKLLEAGGWTITDSYYTFGKWSPLSRLINGVGSLVPSRIGTGIVLHATRKTDL